MPHGTEASPNWALPPNSWYTALWDKSGCHFKSLSLGRVCYAATDNWNPIQQKSMHMYTKRYAQECLLYHRLQKTIGNNLKSPSKGDLKIMIYSCNGIHFSSENEWIEATCDNMDHLETILGKKTIAEGYVQLGSIYIKFQIMQNSTISCLWILTYVTKT